MICRFFESATPGQGVHQWFVLAICGVFIAILLVGAMYFKFVGNSYVLRTGAVFVCHSHFSFTYSGFDRPSDARVSFRLSIADENAAAEVAFRARCWFWHSGGGGSGKWNQADGSAQSYSPAPQPWYSRSG
jgi:hypothetical protein